MVLYGVGKESGKKTRLYSEQEIADLKGRGADVSTLRSNTKNGEYYRFEINSFSPKSYAKEGDYSLTKGPLYGRNLWDANIGKNKRTAGTVGHEAKHVLLYFNDIRKYGKA